MNVDEVLTLLEEHQSDAVRETMGPKYGIHASFAIGVSMADMKSIAKRAGRDHALAAALWATGMYEARTVAALVEVPAVVTAAQMNSWCHDFDNWAICDTVCFNLFDRADAAWQMVDDWSRSDEEFVKRAAFALLWSLALHDRKAGDARFVHGLDLIERNAGDDRNFVTKAIAMAVRAVGRRNDHLAAATLEVAKRLEKSTEPAARRVGRRAVKELTGQ